MASYTDLVHMPCWNNFYFSFVNFVKTVCSFSVDFWACEGAPGPNVEDRVWHFRGLQLEMLESANLWADIFMIFMAARPASAKRRARRPAFSLLQQPWQLRCHMDPHGISSYHGMCTVCTVMVKYDSCCGGNVLLQCSAWLPFWSLLTHCHNAKGDQCWNAQAYMSNRECEGWVGMTFQHEVGTSRVKLFMVPGPRWGWWGLMGFLCVDSKAGAAPSSALLGTFEDR